MTRQMTATSVRGNVGAAIGRRARASLTPRLLWLAVLMATSPGVACAGATCPSHSQPSPRCDRRDTEAPPPLLAATSTPQQVHCEYGTADPSAKPESLAYLAFHGQASKSKVRVEGLITIRFEAMSIRDIQTGDVYWLELSHEEASRLLHCDGFFGVLEGMFDPALKGHHRAYRGGFRNVSYAYGVCNLQTPLDPR